MTTKLKYLVYTINGTLLAGFVFRNSALDYISRLPMPNEFYMEEAK